MLLYKHKVARITTRGSWLAWQLLWREAFDTLQQTVDDRRVPVSAWANKAARAHRVCEQTRDLPERLNRSPATDARRS